MNQELVLAGRSVGTHKPGFLSDSIDTYISNIPEIQ